MAITIAEATRWIAALAKIYREQREYLTELDSAIGDADHGINLDRGFTAVEAAFADKQAESLTELFKTTAMTLIRTVGGASGPLYGTWFLTASKVVGDADAIDMALLAAICRQATDALKQRGKSDVGAKTMIDVWEPVSALLEQMASDGQEIYAALDAAASLADKQVESTIPMQATKGRASFLGERSIGHQDPGATSSAMMIRALKDTR